MNQRASDMPYYALIDGYEYKVACDLNKTELFRLRKKIGYIQFALMSLPFFDIVHIDDAAVFDENKVLTRIKIAIVKDKEGYWLQYKQGYREEYRLPNNRRSSES